MSYKSFIAKRFLFAKGESNFISFIALISITGVAIGVAVLIISVSILNGFERAITEKTVSLSSHIQITSFKPEGIRDYQHTINILKDTSNHFGVVSLNPYVQHEAVIKFKDKTEGIILKGIRNEDGIFSNKRKIINGTGLLTLDDTSIIPLIIGNKLANKLGINLDNKVFIIATIGIPSPVNPPTVKPFKIVGIYESGLRDYDDIISYTDLTQAQKLFSMGKNVTGIEVMIMDIDKIAETTARMTRVLNHPDNNAKSIFTIYRGLFTWVELQKKPIPIVLGLISIVAAFNIIGFLLMIVLEKTEEIGILKSLGASSMEIIKIFFFQGMIISLIGILFGNLLGYGLCLIQLKFDIIKIPDIYYVTKVPIQLSLNTGLLITLITLCLSLLVTIIPSYLASKLNPITSLRFK
jgi:lipoprotein-releasing system permease protein